MKALILAAGFGTRFANEIGNLDSGEENDVIKRKVLGKPKGLFPIGEAPVLAHILGYVRSIDEVDGVYIVTNDAFFNQYSNWCNDFQKRYSKKLHVVNDGVKKGDFSLGTTGDLEFVIEQVGIDEDIFVIPGGFLANFDLSELPEKFREYGSTTIVTYRITDPEIRKRHGVAWVDEENKVVDFEEKPEESDSELVAPAVYIISKKHVSLIKKFLAEDEDNKDQIGRFIGWLINNNCDVFTHTYEGTRYDCGKLDGEHGYREIMGGLPE